MLKQKFNSMISSSFRFISGRRSYVASEGRNIAKSADASGSVQHLSKDALLAFNVRDNRYYKNRFVKPFNRFNNYNDIVKYIEWSYPATGLTMEKHIANVNFLREALSYRMFNSLLKLYHQRFVMIPNKYEFNMYDKRNLAKPEKLLISLISRRYMKPKAFFTRKFFSAIESELKDELDVEGGRDHENVQNLTLKKLNTLYTSLPDEEKAVYVAEARAHQETLDKVFQISSVKHGEE